MCLIVCKYSSVRINRCWCSFNIVSMHTHTHVTYRLLYNILYFIVLQMSCNRIPHHLYVNRMTVFFLLSLYNSAGFDDLDITISIYYYRGVASLNFLLRYTEIVYILKLHSRPISGRN